MSAISGHEGKKYIQRQINSQNIPLPPTCFHRKPMIAISPNNDSQAKNEHQILHNGTQDDGRSRVNDRPKMRLDRPHFHAFQCDC